MGNILKHNFENLEIWQLGMEIADLTCDITEKFPVKERFGLISQMNRSSVSMPSNIAEGSSGSETSFARYLGIALGSSFELQTQLIISKRRKYLTEVHYDTLIKELKRFQRMTINFQKSLVG